MVVLGGQLQGASGTSSAGSISLGNTYGETSSIGDSIGESHSYGEQKSEGRSWGNGWGYETGTSHSAQQAESDWGGYANGNAYGHTFGKEASAQDVQNAYTANAIEREMWAMQAAYNAREAEKSRQFQERMSNTAYQRATQDLIKAGLNPILAAGAAATAPVGATASAGLSSAHKANAYAESISRSQNSSRDWGKSRSSGYSESKHDAKNGYENGSYNNSYGYNKSDSYNKSHQESHGYNTGQNSARSWESSEYSNNIKEIAQSAMNNITSIHTDNQQFKLEKAERDKTNSILGKAKNIAKTAQQKSDKFGSKRPGYHR